MLKPGHVWQDRVRKRKIEDQKIRLVMAHTKSLGVILPPRQSPPEQCFCWKPTIILIVSGDMRLTTVLKLFRFSCVFSIDGISKLELGESEGTEDRGLVLAMLIRYMMRSVVQLNLDICNRSDLGCDVM